MDKLLKKYKNLPIEIKASAWYMVCNIVLNALGFLTLPIFSRMLTTEQYGLSSVYSTWMNLLIIFTNLNIQLGVFNNAMVKFEKDRDVFISSMQGLTTVLSIAWLLVYILAYKIWNQLFQLPTMIMIIMAIEMLFFPAKDYWSGKLRFEYKYKSIVIYTIALAIINLSICILAICLVDDNKGIIRIITSSMINIMFYSVIYIHNFIKGKTFFHREYWGYALKFALPLIVYYVSQMIFNQSDKLMIQHMVGVDKVGIYSLVYTCSNVFIFIINAINAVLVPWKYKKIQENQLEKIKKVSTIVVFMVGIVIFLVILIGPELIKFVATEEYYEAIWIMPPVIGSLFFLFLTQLFVNIEFYFEKKMALVKGASFSAIINIVLNYFAIKQWGYIAAGYTTLIAFIIFASLNSYYVSQICKNNLNDEVIYDIKKLFIMSIVFLGLLFITLLIYPYPIIRWISVGIIILLIFVLYKKYYLLLKEELKK